MFLNIRKHVQIICEFPFPAFFYFRNCHRRADAAPHTNAVIVVRTLEIRYGALLWCPNMWPVWIDSLAPGKFEWNCRYIVFKLILVNKSWSISSAIEFRWMSLDFTDDKSTLFQVMAWCRQATSHYLSQCWPRSMSPYSVTRSQWVNKPIL